MVRKILLITFLMILIALNVKANSLNLSIRSYQYAPNSPFDGILLFNKTGNYSYNSLFIATTNNNDYNISLKKWLDDSGLIYSMKPGYYDINSDPWNRKQVLSSKGTKLVGFRLSRNTLNIVNVSFLISGFGDLKLDIGNDQKSDWQYNGNQVGYYPETFPDGYNINSIADREALLKGVDSIRRCEKINLTFNELFTASKLNINVMAKKLASGSDLNVTISNKECKLPTSDLNSEIPKKVNCEITIENPKSQFYEICLSAKGGDSNTVYYKVPTLNEFYFITANISSYNTTLNGNVIVKSNNINNIFQNLLNKCDSDYCFIPINVILDSDGQVNFDDILLIDRNLIEYNSMYDLKNVSDSILLNNQIKLELNKFNIIKTPESKGEYNLKIMFQNETSNVVSYNTTDAPTAIISPSAYISAVNRTIIFSANNSKSQNSQIVKYLWDFGDGKTATGVIVSHSYQALNEYNITLTVEDKFSIKSSTSLTIYIESQEKMIPNLLNQTLNQLTLAEKSLLSSTSDVLAVYRVLNYNSLIREYKLNISNLEEKYEQILRDNSSDKESEYTSITTQIDDIRNGIPLKIYIISVQQYENDFPELTDIPDPKAFKKEVSDTEYFKTQIYSFILEKAKINSEVKNINIVYIKGNESFILVKKTIDTLETDINTIESFGSENIDDITILQPSDYNKKDDFNIIEFGSEKEIVYKSNNVVGKTIVIPKAILQVKESICGDKICSDEEYKNNSCHKDCKKRPWNILIIIGITVVIGTSYINFYKGPWNYRNLGNALSVKLTKKRLFTNQQDLTNLGNYVRGVLNKGYNEQQIMPLLLNKGWKKEQIDYAFKKAKDMQKFK